MDQKILRSYARLLMEKGVVVEKGQHVHISLPVEVAYFAPYAAEAAYDCGAHDVHVTFHDDYLSKLRTNFADIEALREPQVGKDAAYQYIMDNGGCTMGISSPNYLISQGTDLERRKIVRANRSEVQEKFNNCCAGNLIRWSVAAIPNPVWAKRIYPELDEDTAVEHLWQDILNTCHIDPVDGTIGWAEHTAKICAVKERLNGLNLDTLHFESPNGTNFTVWMCDGGHFEGGQEHDPKGVNFSANMPTEELFTSPNRLKTEGIVRSTKPLLSGGETIENFTLTFKAGKVVDFTAEKGYDMLKSIIETDGGSCYLGECALVPQSSPINRIGQLFYYTLFDENAVCHLALGQGFSSTLENPKFSKEECMERGLNFSSVHVDFMFGNDELLCIGTTKSGEKITIMEKGEFVF